MKTNVTLNDDATDEIVCAKIKESIELIEPDIKKLKRRKRLMQFEKEDLQEDIKNLTALKIVYDYYRPIYLR